jgi:hypothetical protein
VPTECDRIIVISISKGHLRSKIAETLRQRAKKLRLAFMLCSYTDSWFQQFALETSAASVLLLSDDTLGHALDIISF